MMRLLFLCFTTLGMLPACSHLSKEYKAQIKAIRVAPVREKPTAYVKPHFRSPQEGMAFALTTGLAPALGGAAMAAAMAATSQGPRTSKEALSVLKDETPKDMSSMLGDELTTALKVDPFFGPRMKHESTMSWAVTSTIIHYTLWKNNDGTYYPVVGAETRLVGPGGEKAIYRISTSVTRNLPSPSAPLADYLSNPALLRDHYAKAIHALAANIARSLSDAVQ